MMAARLEKIKEVFHRARELDPAVRKSFLDESCGGDESLRTQIEALLKSHDQAEGFIANLPSQLAAELLTKEETDSVVGSTIGHYKIVERIGAGGMGEVYLAEDVRSGRKAALKLLPQRFAADRERFERFQREARAVIALNHPNILTIYEIGEENSVPYIVSELIEGETLRARLERGQMSLEEIVDLAMQLASALAAAHKSGIVHRDIKPENIMLRQDDYVKVLDFGIAKLAEPEVAAAPDQEAPLNLQTVFGSTMGTLRYMSPEQTRGEHVDERTDVWSLGVVLYEMLAGAVPFPDHAPKEIIEAIQRDEPRPIVDLRPETPAELQRIVARALSKDRQQRYAGAAEMLADFKTARHHLEVAGDLAQARPISNRRTATLATAALIAIATLTVWMQTKQRSVPAAGDTTKTVIAILPFQNLSEDKANAYFADGVQDEILTHLTKIADLKVISRTSVMQYQAGAARNLREIGQQLGVGHVLEGSVQRAGNRVRINAQLIDARTDAHVWAQTFDRELADIFAIQTEIAKAIAEQLQAKMLAREKLAIEEKPTRDLAAYDLYLRGGQLIDAGLFAGAPKKNVLDGIAFLEQAIARDPKFFVAYCKLSRAHNILYLLGLDHSPDRLSLAERVIDAALRLRPEAAEAHLALANHLYSKLDYAAARTQIEFARRTLRNDPRVLELSSYIDRRQGRWAESVRDLERALELDPNNVLMLQQISTSYTYLHQLDKAVAAMDRVLSLKPDDLDSRLNRAQLELLWKADSKPLHRVIEQFLRENPESGSKVAGMRSFLAQAEHDPVAGVQAAADLGENPWGPDAMQFPPSYFEGLFAWLAGDAAAAEAAFTKARAVQQKIVDRQPDYAPALCVLGLLDARLGRKEDALREGRTASELLPPSKDAINGPNIMTHLAMIYACVGEKDLAIEQIERTLRRPARLNYGQLRLMPQWDPLRGDPRFEKIVASLAPKEK